MHDYGFVLDPVFTTNNSAIVDKGSTW